LNVELINTGSELLLGFVTNTNQQWLCRELTSRGYLVQRQVTVSDRAPDIQEAVRAALGRAELVICTGGLGPTSDDLTRPCIAEMCGRTLREDAKVLAEIENFFRTRQRPMAASTRVQALVPEGAVVLPNHNGTAPGLAIDIEPQVVGRAGGPGLLIMLPGPPRELKPMFLNAALPVIQQRFPQPEVFVCRVLRSTGIGESTVEERIEGPLSELVRSGLEIGYCARFGEVDVRLVARGAEGEGCVGRAEQIVRSIIGKHIFGGGSDELHEVVIRELSQRHKTLALAESCTGGFIAHRLTNVPGASAVFLGGFVTYSNEAKQNCLGVSAETLALHGAVSEGTALQMAEGARARLGADFALAVTGIAGPTGGSEEKPVGTVFMALAGGGPTVALKQINRYDRESFKFVTSQQALELLRRRMVQEA
jgi:nicotinamide-nucleotide amidase